MTSFSPLLPSISSMYIPHISLKFMASELPFKLVYTYMYIKYNFCLIRIDFSNHKTEAS